MSYTVGSLFAGIGGICQGFKNAGFSLSWANEYDKYACMTYKKNFKHQLIEADIHRLNPSQFAKVDVLTSGFPCQAFSVAGYRKGFTDERGNLFFETLRFIKYLRPKVILLENVKNLHTHDKGNTFKVIKEEIEKSNYTFSYFILNTCSYGNIPQNRERIYIIGFDKTAQQLENVNSCDQYDLQNFLHPKKVTLTKTVQDLLEKQVLDNKYYYNNTKYYPMLKDVVKNQKTVYQLRRIYVRENKNNLCPTLTANMGTGGHNVPLVLDDYGIRKLTPKECLKLQGFPSSFKLPDIANCHIYKQAGNSVSVPVIEQIALNIKKVFEKETITYSLCV